MTTGPDCKNIYYAKNGTLKKDFNMNIIIKNIGYTKTRGLYNPRLKIFFILRFSSHSKIPVLLLYEVELKQ